VTSPAPPVVARIISGGQTGADRGALDAAADLGLPHGGFCPKGRLAEDGVIPPRYQLEETASAEYAERTRRNVEVADATVVFSYGRPTGGSAFTVSCAETVGRPVLVVNLNASTAFDACLVLDEFIQRHRPRTLNVAGSRESGAPGIADRVRTIVRRVLSTVRPCEHLRPLEGALLAVGVRFGPIVSPSANDRMTWFMCEATFDELSLRSRLNLPDFLGYTEYDGRVAGADATFACARCNHAILGYHPLCAPRGALRVA
jgi:hypothetical protein